MNDELLSNERLCVCFFLDFLLVYQVNRVACHNAGCFGAQAAFAQRYGAKSVSFGQGNLFLAEIALGTN